MVGTVVEEMQDLCGYDQNTVVYAGIGDAGATTLASGIASFGEFNVNIGTSGWVATISNSPLDLHGRVFNLAGFSEKPILMWYRSLMQEMSINGSRKFFQKVIRWIMRNLQNYWKAVCRDAMECCFCRILQGSVFL